MASSPWSLAPLNGLARYTTFCALKVAYSALAKNSKLSQKRQQRHDLAERDSEGDCRKYKEGTKKSQGDTGNNRQFDVGFAINTHDDPRVFAGYLVAMKLVLCALNISLHFLRSNVTSVIEGIQKRFQRCPPPELLHPSLFGKVRVSFRSVYQAYCVPTERELSEDDAPLSFYVSKPLCL